MAEVVKTTPQNFPRDQRVNCEYRAEFNNRQVDARNQSKVHVRETAGRANLGLFMIPR